MIYHNLLYMLQERSPSTTFDTLAVLAILLSNGITVFFIKRIYQILDFRLGELDHICCSRCRSPRPGGQGRQRVWSAC